MISYHMQARIGSDGKPYIYVEWCNDDPPHPDGLPEGTFTVEEDGWELVVTEVVDSRGGGFEG